MGLAVEGWGGWLADGVFPRAYLLFRALHHRPCGALLVVKAQLSCISVDMCDLSGEAGLSTRMHTHPHTHTHTVSVGIEPLQRSWSRERPGIYHISTMFDSFFRFRFTFQFPAGCTLAL